MITMDNIIREGHPTLRRSADPVTFPLSAEDRSIAAEMMEFLSNSQDEKIAEQLNLRAGVGLAAPQIDVSKRIVALLIPGNTKMILRNWLKLCSTLKSSATRLKVPA